MRTPEPILYRYRVQHFQRAVIEGRTSTCLYCRRVFPHNFAEKTNDYCSSTCRELHGRASA